MEVQNVRMGHACNSSSSHSMVFADGVRDDYDGIQEFGWSNFTLAAPESKMAYLAAQLFGRIKGRVGDKTAALIVNGLLGVNVGDDGYVDHQSAWTLPRDHKGGQFNDAELFSFGFLGDLKAFLLRDDLVVLGGNDNSDGHPLGQDGAFELPTNGGGRHLVARKDYGVWTLFNQVSGTKVRLSFDTLPEAPDFKPVTPELFDLKITDFCPFNCPYCYQGSSRSGVEPDLRTWHVAGVLSEMKVFEAAIGGGEPTTHPMFGRLVKELRRADVVPNVTTRDLNFWFTPSGEEVLNHAGGIALSVDSMTGVTALAKALDKMRTPHRGKFSVQVVEGVTDWFGLRGILKEAKREGFPVTILGFKRTGRGATYNVRRHAQKHWLEVVEGVREDGGLPRLSVDTVIADRDQEAMEEAGISRLLYHTEEGRYSMYWDLVTGRVGPSSFCRPEEMVELDPKKDQAGQIQRAFSQWPV